MESAQPVVECASAEYLSPALKLPALFLVPHALPTSPYPQCSVLRRVSHGISIHVQLQSRRCFAIAHQDRRRRHLTQGTASENANVSTDLRRIVSNVAVVLLAGGSGSRMKADRPKQFLELDGKTVAEHSLDLFVGMPQVSQIVLVVAEQFRPMFMRWIPGTHGNCKFCFADPGMERQDSVFNGLSKVDKNASLVCVHDVARPLVSRNAIESVMQDAEKYGAAVLGVPSKATIKESDDGKFVLRTIERWRLWEVQTPQVVRPDLLRKGFAKVRSEHLSVTDDVSIVEYLGQPVRITMGEYTNIKLTTPEDMSIARSILKERERSQQMSTSVISLK